LTTYPNGGLGSRSLAGGSIHAGGRPSSFATSWPAVTNSLRASIITIERGHGSGSITVMDCGGAVRIGEAKESGARSECYAIAKERAQLWVGSGRDEDDRR
jgi:hypothetical protein